jgi:outer membrane protein assembly factor BamB
MNRTLSVLAVCLGLSAPVGADDWPQWRGPDRTEVSKETGLLKEWPKAGPKLLWTYDQGGNAYSGPAVVGDRLYTMGTQSGSDVVIAIDTRSGKQVWASRVGEAFKQDRGDGPRGTPTVDGNALYAVSGRGEVICLATADGARQWSVNFRNDLGGRLMSGWGYSESPLVDGDKLIVTPGGQGGTLAALDKKTGKVIWRSNDLKDAAGYSSPIVAEVAGVRQYIQTTAKGVAGVAADSGKLLWRYEQTLYRTAVVPTPIYHDGHVYATSGYGAGCDLIKLTPQDGAFKAEKVYANKNMVNHHGGVVLYQGHVYGYSDGKGWVCQNFKTGEIVWSERGKLGKGSLTLADGKLYCYSEDRGTQVLVDASPAGWKEHGRFTIPRESQIRAGRGKFWTHPVVANGRLYLRDQDLIFAFDVKGTDPSKQ